MKHFISEVSVKLVELIVQIMIVIEGLQYCSRPDANRFFMKMLNDSSCQRKRNLLIHTRDLALPSGL